MQPGLAETESEPNEQVIQLRLLYTVVLFMGLPSGCQEKNVDSHDTPDTSEYRTGDQAPLPVFIDRLQALADREGIYRDGQLGWKIRITREKGEPDRKVEPYLIKIDENGNVYANSDAAEELLDTRVSSRGLPLAGQRLSIYHAACEAGGQKAILTLHLLEDSKPEMVKSLLNTAAKAEIDLIELRVTDGPGAAGEESN